MSYTEPQDTHSQYYVCTPFLIQVYGIFYCGLVTFMNSNAAVIALQHEDFARPACMYTFIHWKTVDNSHPFKEFEEVYIVRQVSVRYTITCICSTVAIATTCHLYRPQNVSPLNIIQKNCHHSSISYSHVRLWGDRLNTT